MTNAAEYETRAKSFESYIRERMAEEALAGARRSLRLVTITVAPPTHVARPVTESLPACRQPAALSHRS